MLYIHYLTTVWKSLCEDIIVQMKKLRLRKLN